MGKLTEQPFSESCCDGGATSCNDMSAQSCGCDKGANHLCERHLKEQGQLTQCYQNVPAAGNSAMPFLSGFTMIPAPVGLGGAPTRATTLPTNPQDRKKHPVASGVLDYFPDALVEIARVSWEGNEQHNPGLPLHWDRNKSQDEADTLIRHFLERGTRDKDGMRHSAKMAWRALALLQKEIENDQRPLLVYEGQLGDAR